MKLECLGENLPPSPVDRTLKSYDKTRLKSLNDLVSVPGSSRKKGESFYYYVRQREPNYIWANKTTMVGLHDPTVYQRKQSVHCTENKKSLMQQHE